MGRFLNTTYAKTVESLEHGMIHRLDNPFYMFTDKHPTPVTFYNVNDTQSTLDDGTKDIQDVIGPDAPLRYNKITNVMLFGIERISTELEIGDYGLENSEIEGECILPPGTFKPYADSYFTIDYVTKNKCWFRITKVTTDTLENGSNFWKMSYVLDKVGKDFDLDSLVMKHFRMISDNVGSNYKSIIQDEEYDFVERLESVCETLSNYYHSIFWKEQLQTYIFKYAGAEFYDPEVIEFMIRNKVMDYGDKYVYIEQATTLPDTFCIDYDKSIYRNIETKNKKVINHRYYGIENRDPMSLLSMRLQSYYIVHQCKMGVLAEPIPTYSNDLVRAISGEKDFGDKYYYNIIRNYFYGPKLLNDKMIDSLENIQYCDNTELFHELPIILYILKWFIVDTMEVKKPLKKFE